MICEDDVEFNDNFPISMNIPVSFGMFYLCYYDYENLSFVDPDSNKYTKDSKYNLIKLCKTRSTINYILNKKTYDLILEIEKHNT